MPIKKTKLEKLIIDAGTDVRNEISESVVEEYSEAITNKAKFPALIVFESSDGLVLADGFHRYFAFERQGVKEYDCDIRNGTKTDALKFALGSNTTHGYRRTNADKRNAVMIALREFSKLSNRAVADLCFIHRSTVDEIQSRKMEQKTERGKSRKVRKQTRVAESAPSNAEKPAKATTPPRVTGKDGKSYPARITARPEPEKPKTMDATGIPVPEEIIPQWDAALDEANRLLNMTSEIRMRLKRAQDSNEPIFREIDHADCIAKLDQVYADLKRAKPYAVCPDSNGIPAGGATAYSKSLCKGRGYISEFAWTTLVPAEKKKIAGRV